MLAGTPEQLDVVISANVIPILIRLISEGEAKVRREAAWAITNLICGGTDEQVKYAISQGCIRPLCEVLDAQDTKLIQVVLDGIREICRFGSVNTVDGENVCADWIEEAGGVPRVERLQHHENTKIYQKAHDIIETYFSPEEDVVDDAVNPAVADDGSYYQFTAPSNPGNYSFE